MSSFTLAYLARLEVFGLLFAGLEGALVYLSWRAWERAMRRETPNLRHLVICGHFGALALLPILTLVILHSSLAATSLPPSAALRTGLMPLTPGDSGWGAMALGLTALWAIGVVIMGLRLWRDAQRVSRLKLEGAPASLVEMVHELAHGWIEIQRTHVCTADVLVPQVVGVWRSTLLAPRDFGERLSLIECKAVLLHELAHVRRRDYAWNLVQRLMLVLLWFHPCAWALYGELAREREVCCDALAVDRGASASGLARALVRLAAPKRPYGVSMAASHPGALSFRVHRLVDVPASASPRRAFRLPALVLSAACLLAVGAGGLAANDPSLGELYNASAFGPTISIKAHDPLGSFDIQVKQGRVVAASFGQMAIPLSRIRQVGGRVTLMASSNQPLLALIITPQGRISWTPRT